MKKVKYISFLVVSMLIVSSLQAQDLRLLKTKIADILMLMPTNDLNHRDRLMADMLDLGEEGLTQIAALIVAPGTGDDTNARFALANLAHYVMLPGQEEGRLMLSRVFTNRLKSDADKEVKAFFLYHLDFFGKNEVAKEIATFLPDERLNEPAVKALVSNGSHAVAHVMMDALPKLKGKQLARTIYGIGELSEPHALNALSAYEESDDPAVKAAVIYAYSKMGSPDTYKYMIGAAKAVNYSYEPSRATPCLLDYANSLARNGELELCKKICETLLKKCTEPAQVTYALSAIDILSTQFGYQAMEYLLDGIKHPDKAYRGAVLESAAGITDIGATRDWIEVYPELTPDVQVEMIQFFGNRGDELAVPLVADAMFGNNSSLKQVAMMALGQLMGTAAVPHLLAVMTRSADEDVLVAKDVLNTLVGPNEMSLIASAYEKLNDAGKAAIIQLIGDRGDDSFFALVSSNAGSENKNIQSAAYKALPEVSNDSNFKSLVSMLYKTKEEEYVPYVQKALVTSSKSFEKNQAGPILDAYTGATKMHKRFIPILPQLGGDKALKEVHKTFTEGNAELKETAFEALTNWKDYTASSVLFDICKSGNNDYQDKAFTGYVRQIKGAPVPADQKLLLLRKIMPLADNTGQKLLVIDALKGNKTFLTLIYLGSLMENADLANAAGRAAASVALPPSGSKEGMYGVEVKKVLRKAMQVISGEESGYVKTEIQRWLDEMPVGEGYVSMFNGKDLSGWQGLVKNPIARAKMSEKELAEEQARADARLPENWTVANGEIQFTGTGYENLCSIKDYEDFEMVVDWRITKRGDSGIYLRGTPQVQIWDTSRVEVGAQVGSGGLYNNQKNQSKPLKVADNPINDWNTFYIKMVGEHVTVKLNGEIVVDNVVLENYWDRSIPIFPSGPIELQAHGTDLAFRDVYVREIKSETYNLTAQEQADGFVALFNGKNLDGWTGNMSDYKVEDGLLVIDPQGGGHGNLYTAKEYGDFAFRFEFQLTPGANNGIGIRTPNQGDAAYVGMEIQVLDNTAAVYANLQPYQYHGSVYGVIPAKRGFLNPVGEWNSEEIWIQGNRIKVTLNGTVIVDGDLEEASKNGTMDHNEHPGLQRDSGYIGFCGHGFLVRFRNIRIKEL